MRCQVCIQCHGCHSAKCEVHPRDTVILIKTRARPVAAQGNPKDTVQAEGQSQSRNGTGMPCSCCIAHFAPKPIE